MCKKSREIVDHVLLHSEVAMSLWNDTFARVGLEEGC